MSLDAQALRFLEAKKGASVGELYDALRRKDSSVSKTQLVDLVWRLAGQHKVELKDVSQAARSFVEYLGMWERTLWLYASLFVSLVTVVSVYALPSGYPFVIVRGVMGLVFTLLIPGYLLTEVLLPKRGNLSSIERFALSIGLSLALLPLVGLLLNFTVWGIRLTPVIGSLVLLTLCLFAAALVRHYTVETHA